MIYVARAPELDELKQYMSQHYQMTAEALESWLETLTVDEQNEQLYEALVGMGCIEEMATPLQ